MKKAKWFVGVLGMAVVLSFFVGFEKQSQNAERAIIPDAQQKTLA